MKMQFHARHRTIVSFDHDGSRTLIPPLCLAPPYAHEKDLLREAWRRENFEYLIGLIVVDWSPIFSDFKRARLNWERLEELIADFLAHSRTETQENRPQLPCWWS
jgi:hypothetical protein